MIRMKIMLVQSHPVDGVLLPSVVVGMQPPINNRLANNAAINPQVNNLVFITFLLLSYIYCIINQYKRRGN